MFIRAQVHTTVAGTTVVVPPTSGKSVWIARLFRNPAGNGTVDYQDTSGASLVGGPLAIGTNEPTQWLDCAKETFDRQCPLFVTGVGLGFQIVTTSTLTIAGFVDYLLNPP